MLDNFPLVKSYWIMLGQDTAAAAINFGASDLDGTIGQEKIAHAALARSPVGMAEDGMVHLIREAGKTPVQRDALYRVVREYGRADAGAASAPRPVAAAPAAGWRARHGTLDSVPAWAHTFCIRLRVVGRAPPVEQDCHRAGRGLPPTRGGSMRRALVLPLFTALALIETLMYPALSRGDGGLFGPSTQDRQRWFVSPTAHLSSTSNLPNSSNCYFDKCIVSCPAGDSVYTVVVHDVLNVPVPNSDVVIDFSFCGSVVLAESDPPGQYLLGPGTVLRTTNSLGRADFPLASGGTCAPGPIKVYASGQLLGSRRFVASFDQDGDLAVTEADLALVQAKVGTSDLTADFDCDSAVTSNDYDIAITHLGHGHSSLIGIGGGPAIGFCVRALSNPSRGAVEFELRAPEGGRARLAIYDVSGRRLATVLDREIEAGIRRVSWSGRDDGGRAVASGVYRYRLTVGAREAQGALVVAR